MLAGLWSRIAALLGRGGPARDTRWWGRRGERDAARYLKKLGYRVLGRNVDLGYAEADLVCQDPDGRTVVLVEVKTRVRFAAGSAAGRKIAPEASITAHKRRKLLTAFAGLAKANDWASRPKRIDVIAVEYEAGAGGRPSPPHIRHHRNAVGR